MRSPARRAGLRGRPTYDAVPLFGSCSSIDLTNQAFRSVLDSSAQIRASAFETLARRIRSYELEAAH
jgi:hypothetical protein